MSIELNIHRGINELSASDWNSLVKDNNPFLRHEFLLAAEDNNCVGEEFGWIPRHLSLHDNGHLIAAMPLYEKHNSYGEFVFDNSWADAYSRHGMRYFPKLVSAIPYTPAIGQRLLCDDSMQQQCYPLLFGALQTLLKQEAFSSFHLLFPDNAEMQYFQSRNALTRHDCQYHWFNDNYVDFDDFMSRLASRKRKNIRRERQSVETSGVTLRRLNGHQASSTDWQHFADFYNRTFAEKWGIATFNLGFFQQISNTLPDNVLLVLADLDDRCIGGALMYVSDTRLYGRHWGCSEQIDNLHFEACYYQGIEFCIENSLQVFEPGAQGEHKVARGFKPVMTRSAHLLADDVFYKPVADFCRHEQESVSQYIEQINEKLPFRKD